MYDENTVPFTVTSTSGEYLFITAGAVTPTSATTYAASIWGDSLPTIGNGWMYQPAGFYADASATSEQIPANPADTAGFTPRHTWVWAAVSQQGVLCTANANPYNQGGSLAGWTATGGAITAATPPGNPPPQPSGVLLTPSGASAVPAASAGSAPVTPGTQYQVVSNFFAAGAATARTGFAWYSTAGTYLSSSSAATTISAGSWAAATCWGTAPAGAATAVPFAGLYAGGGNVPATLTTYIAGIAVVGQVPAPQASWSGGLTSALMNGPSGPRQALALLNNPPVMRWNLGLTTSIPNATPTVITFDPPDEIGPVYRHLQRLQPGHRGVHSPAARAVPGVRDGPVHREHHRGPLRRVPGHQGRRRRSATSAAPRTRR